MTCYGGGVRRSLFFATAAAAAAVVFACVGGDPDAASNEGELGGPCFTNGTCDVPLVCRAGVCVAAGDAGQVPGSGDGGTSTVPPGDGDAGGCDTRPPALLPRGMQCGSATCLIDNGVKCCGQDQDAGRCLQFGMNCAQNEVSWECMNFENCSGGPCCGSLAVDRATCPAQGQATGAVCAAAGTECNAGTTRLCLNDSHCEGTTHCVRFVVTGPDPRELGACL